MMKWERDGNYAVVPPGGWYYVEPVTEFKFQATTLEQLENQVQSHRVANGIALGCPRVDILEYTRCRLSN